MFRSRLLLLGCVFASLTACDDIPTAPINGGYVPSAGSPTLPSLEVIRGVLEMVDDTRFGLRQAERLVVIRFGDANGFTSVLGREVDLLGKFTYDGEFAVTTWQLVGGNGEDAMLRAPAPQGRVGRSASRR